MLSETDNRRISKFLSYVLRHHPELIAIELDENGWTDINLLIEKAGVFGVKFDRKTLAFIVATNNKKRFAFNDNLTRIRASQGHSLHIDLDYEPQKPPAFLYHGTSINAVNSILATGIQKRSRKHVHLSSDVETAVNVGSRHGKPFVFTVLSEEMFHQGHQFFLSDNGIWLTDYIPAIYLKADKL
jgi:putative RNA 2'-phosphotransferase